MHDPEPDGEKRAHDERLVKLSERLGPHQQLWDQLQARRRRRASLRVQRAELDMQIATEDVAIDQLTARLYDGMIVDVIRSGM